MTTPTTISDAIDENARGPKKVQVGEQSVEQHTIEEQIAADKYAKGQAAAAAPHFGLRMVQLIPPGAG